MDKTIEVRNDLMQKCANLIMLLKLLNLLMYMVVIQKKDSLCENQLQIAEEGD